MKLSRGSAVPGIRRVAVIGGGAAGLFSARLLGEAYDVTLIEAEGRLGGHACTVTVPDGPDAGTGLDAGFINCAHTAYPRLFGYLDHFGIATEPSDSSFCHFNEATGEQYVFSVGAQGQAGGMETAPDPRTFKYLDKLARFYARAAEDLAAGAMRGMTVGDYCRHARLSTEVIERFIAPVYATLWVMPPSEALKLSAESAYTFYRRVGLPSFKDYNARFIVGGSHTYINALMAGYRGRVRLNSPVRAVERGSGHSDVIFADGSRETFDAVVIAVHADLALKLLARPSGAEEELLGAWTYNHCRVVVHGDSAAIPKGQNFRAAWNYIAHGPSSEQRELKVSYYLNRVMELKAQGSYYVTINPGAALDPSKVYMDVPWRHAMFDVPAFETQSRLPSLQGAERTYFCGSYFSCGSHEDAVSSAEAVCRRLGLESTVASWGAKP